MSQNILLFIIDNKIFKFYGYLYFLLAKNKSEGILQ